MRSMKQFREGCLVFVIVTLFFGGCATSDKQKDLIPDGYKYFPKLPAGIQSIEAAKQDLSQLLQSTVGIKYYGQPRINRYEDKEALETLMKGNKSNNVTFWYDGNYSLLYIMLDRLSVLEDRIEISPRIVFFYDDLIDNAIVVEKTSGWAYIGWQMVGCNKFPFTKYTVTVHVPGIISFIFEDLPGAQRLADDLFMVQQTLQREHNARLALFEQKAAQYRASRIKPQVSEAQRKFIVQANTLNQRKDYAGAVKLYLKAIDFDPVSYPAAYFNLALLSAQLKRYNKAISYMQQYLFLVPDAPDARDAKDKIYEWEILMQQNQSG